MARGHWQFGTFSSFVGVAAFLVGVVWAKSGLACRIALEPPHFALSASAEETGEPPTPPQLEEIRVQRSERAPPGPGDCSEIGSVSLVFAVGDSSAEAQQLGIGLTVVEGELPRSMALGGGPYEHENGTLSFAFPDYPDEAFSFSLEARAVDAAGRQSGPTEITVIGEPRSSGSTGGCSTSGGLCRWGAWDAVFLLGAVLLLTRRRDSREARR